MPPPCGVRITTGQLQAAAGAMAHARHVVDDLIQRRIQETHELNFRHRLQSVRRHADRHAGDRRLGQRRVLNPVRAEARLQPGGGAEHAAVRADVLADHDDRCVMLHFPAMRHCDGLDHGYFRQFNDRWAWSAYLRAVARCSCRCAGRTANKWSNMASVDGLRLPRDIRRPRHRPAAAQSS